VNIALKQEVQMTNQEMRNIKESLGVEMFKMNYKAGIRLPNLEAFFAGDDSALDAKARERLEKMLEAELKKSSK
jgi:hypothetical protein